MSMKEIIKRYQESDKEIDDLYCLAEQACIEYPFSIALEYGQGEVSLFLEAGTPTVDMEESWILSSLA